MSLKGRNRQINRVLHNMVANAERREYYAAGSEWKMPSNPRTMPPKVNDTHRGVAEATIKPIALVRLQQRVEV